MKRVGQVRDNCQGVHADDPLKIRSYWTEVHQIYTHCRQIITDELLKIRMAILQSVSNARATNKGE